MAGGLQEQLSSQGVAVTFFEAERCYAAREFFDPLTVCLKWKAAEEALVRSSTMRAIETVMQSKTFEVGNAAADDSPCLVIHAKHQNPAEHDRSASLLSTLWACDAAVGSRGDGAAKLTVGYDFEDAGVHNFSMQHALHFSKLFVNEYPCLVRDVYLIQMPWVLRQLLPLFRPLLSRRVRLIPVDSSEEFVKAVGYESSASFASQVEMVVPRAASLLHRTKKNHGLLPQGNPDHELAPQSSPLLQPLGGAFGSASNYISQLRLALSSINPPLAVSFRMPTLLQVLPLGWLAQSKLIACEQPNPKFFMPNLDSIHTIMHGFSAMPHDGSCTTG